MDTTLYRLTEQGIEQQRAKAELEQRKAQAEEERKQEAPNLLSDCFPVPCLPAAPPPAVLGHPNLSAFRPTYIPWSWPQMREQQRRTKEAKTKKGSPGKKKIKIIVVGNPSVGKVRMTSLAWGAAHAPHTT